MKKRLFNAIVILIASFLIQLLLIIYKHYIGYVPIRGVEHFSAMIISGTILSAIMMGIVFFFDLKMVGHLDRHFIWAERYGFRISLELLAGFVLGGMIGILFTLFSEIIFGYKEPFLEVILSNFFIAAIINLIIIAVIEAVKFFRRNQQAQLKAEILERENISMRFDMLKKQLDPHFLFNSLNILSSLIRRDKKKSQEFIDAFSAVYRYTLEVLDRPVVKVTEELDFARDYLFLQKLRFEEAFEFEIQIADVCREKLLPPLALQILIENAFKHNIATKKKPLRIKIQCEREAARLIVSNNIQQKISIKNRRGIGLENLKNRYTLVTDSKPEIEKSDNLYLVKLPLLEAD